MTRPRLLDLTRSLRRVGRVATGVDRVERAYLAHFLEDDVPVYGLFRTALGYVLLDQNGLTQFQDRLERRATWGPVGMMSRFARQRDPVVQQAESDVRRFACARRPRSGLVRMLGRTLGSEFDYFNVGHSNLTDRVLRGVKAGGGTIHVMIHDVIPLEYPLFQRPGTAQTFGDMLRRVGAIADRVIYNSADTQLRAEEWLQKWGRVPPSIVSHLGTIMPQADADELPPNLPPPGAYFVTVGTIEPRKNHAFLLDLWEDWGKTAPPLLICGSRGWNNDAVFDRLDHLPSNGPIKEVSNLSDAALAALVQRSAGTLFPSLAEGFGLPPVEALSLGARVLCNELPVLREILDQQATFIPVFERELWLNTLQKWEKHVPSAQDRPVVGSTGWSDHFKTVLRSR